MQSNQDKENPPVRPTRGLDDSAVAQRQARWGKNEIAEEKRNAFLTLLTYFWGPIPWMIEAAAILSAAIQHWAEFGVIATLLLANAVVGFWEEHQAGNTIDALRKKLSRNARVLRNGSWATLPARELVPDDVVRIRMGDIVPADVQLEPGSSPVTVDQSALTGESLPVERSVGDQVYSGSIVKHGEVDAVVVAIGAETYFGRTAGLVQQSQKRSHFQKAVLRIGRFLILVAVALVALIVVTSLVRGESLATTLQFALVLTVAGIPVAMPTVLTVAMAVGSRTLARNQAVVTRLAAVEELAGMDVLCSDKTGTLTQNALRVGTPEAIGSSTADQVVQAAAWASRQENDDAIDDAVIVASEALKQTAEDELIEFVPFDPVSKRTEATIRRTDGTTLRVAKGAAASILELADASDDVRSQVLDRVEALAKRGYRALVVAESTEEDTWRVLGLLPLSDPPRADAAETIREACELGIEVKMVTGDQRAIARETASQLGLGRSVMAASDLEAKTASQLAEANVFAEVFPEHKHSIVKSLQQHGHIVGMTGDGVNDAPALKQADTGVAVSGATDAARSAADIVLLTPGLSVIVDAVRESRRIFRRMTSYATYRIAETLRVLLFMVASILVFDFYPVTAVMIVLLALLNDGAILAIAFDRAEPSPHPQAWSMREVLGIATVLGIFGVLESFTLFWVSREWFHLGGAMLQTLIYLKLSLAGHLTVFVTRTKGPFWKSRPAPVLMGAVIGTQVLATLVSVYGLLMAPIGWKWAGVVWGYALIGFVLEDAIKLIAYRILPKLPRFARRGGNSSVGWAEPAPHHSY